MSTARINTALASFKSLAIDLNIADLGKKIANLIADVGQLHLVTVGDLKVFKCADGSSPTDVVSALVAGTKFFDAVYYFALEAAARPACLDHVAVAGASDTLIMEVKHYLLWTALFLMLRGSYPESGQKTVGTDVPSFLVKICGMTCSPLEVAQGLASFDLKKINANWISGITWTGFAPAVRQRLALGLAGYRLLGPFKIYNCKEGVSEEVKAAFDWAREVAIGKLDFSILSCTRSPALIQRLGSWNKALGNLILECFTEDEINEMLTLKILFQRPVKDPRANTWRSWVAGGPLELTNPIPL